jgi:hypothetical protein
MNRESYLRALAEGLEPLFQAHGATYPDRIRFTCGWPAKGAGSRRKTVGQCFDPAASKDDHHEIIVGMSLDDPMTVAHTLAHELCHAVVGTTHGHKKPFRKLALAVGLVGKMTATTAGEAFTRHVQPILDELGEYPHAELDYSTVKKQTTRMIKATCDECAAESENGQGYTVRLTRKWLDAAGPPICPIHETTMGV